jgi:hypothetical protein
MIRSTWLVAVGLCMAACGSDGSPVPPGTTSVSGIAGSQMVSMKDATGIVGPVTENGGTVQEADVVLTNYVGVCSSLEENGNPANGALVGLLVASASPVGPGTYTVTANGAVQALYESQDANCIIQVSETAVSGTITYDTVNGSTIAGSVDLMFPTVDHVSGTFSAPVCNHSPNSLVMLSGKPPAACKQP